MVAVGRCLRDQGDVPAAAGEKSRDHPATARHHGTWRRRGGVRRDSRRCHLGPGSLWPGDDFFAEFATRQCDQRNRNHPLVDEHALHRTVHTLF